MEEKATLTPDEVNIVTKILTELQKNSLYTLFKTAVTNPPDYAEKVKEPMDFSTIKKKLSENKYTTINDVLNDFKLINANCLLYNSDQSCYSYVSQDMLNWVEKRMKESLMPQEELWKLKLDKKIKKLHEHLRLMP